MKKSSTRTSFLKDFQDILYFLDDMYAHYPYRPSGARQRHHVEHEKCRGDTHIPQNRATEFLQVLLQTEQIKQLKNISIQVRNAPIKTFWTKFSTEQISRMKSPGTDRCFRKENRKKIDYRHGKRERHERRTIIGVAIVIKGTTSGVVTDINRNFSIKAAPDNILQFRFLGMKDKDLPIPANHQLNVIMEDDCGSLKKLS
ncbi:MAG: carboxypeptidase-like regulatory domain-containing protein [Butyricimonas faecihominis]